MLKQPICNTTKLDSIDTQPRLDISPASRFYELCKGRARPSTSDHACFSLCTLENPDTEREGETERERAMKRERPIVSLPFMIDGKANVGNTTRQRTIKISRARTDFTIVSSLRHFFLNFLLFEQRKISTMNDERFAHLFFFISDQDVREANWISKPWKNISRYFKCARVVDDDRIIFFQILAKKFTIFLFKVSLKRHSFERKENFNEAFGKMKFDRKIWMWKIPSETEISNRSIGFIRLTKNKG